MTPEYSNGGAEQQFDLIVVGAGSGNSVIGPEFDDLTVALIDDGDPFGGTCLNAGCIPTKMFVRVADVAADAQDAARLGLNARIESVDWPAIRDRVFTRTDDLSRSGLNYRSEKSPNVTVFRQTHTFIDQHTLAGPGGMRISGTSIVIAAGSRPRPLQAAHEPDPAIHDSDSVMRIDTLPASLLIAGGGPVAVEFAHIFSSLGVDVTLVTRSERMLTTLDDDVSALYTHLADGRWRRFANDTITAVERAGPELKTSLRSGRTIRSEAVLVAHGRIPNTDRLHAASAGFDLHDDGRIQVDANQRVLSDGVPLPDVYALGDVSSAWQLKHVANHEARVVEHNLAHPADRVDGDLQPVPAAIFSHPQIAHFGATEADAARTHPDAVVVTTEYGSTAYGWALEDETSFCKLIVEAETGLILGAHIIGPEASILIQPLIMAASNRMSVRGLARGQYWPHPAASEVVENALLSAEAAL